MSGDVAARARELLDLPPCTECGGDHSRTMRVEIRDMLAELVPELVAEVEKLRGALETIRRHALKVNNAEYAPILTVAMCDILAVIERAGIES